MDLSGLWPLFGIEATSKHNLWTFRVVNLPKRLREANLEGRHFQSPHSRIQGRA